MNLVFDLRPGEATVVNLTTAHGGRLKFTVVCQLSVKRPPVYSLIKRLRKVWAGGFAASWFTCQWPGSRWS